MEILFIEFLSIIIATSAFLISIYSYYREKRYCQNKI